MFAGQIFFTDRQIICLNHSITRVEILPEIFLR